jgi:hypothetical protein
VWYRMMKANLPIESSSGRVRLREITPRTTTIGSEWYLTAMTIKESPDGLLLCHCEVPFFPPRFLSMFNNMDA